MEIRKIKKEELQETMDFAWKVFLKFEAPDYPEEGVEEFRRSIYDSEFVSKLEIYGAFEENKILYDCNQKYESYSNVFCR